jgi:hypothetical protein
MPDAIECTRCRTQLPLSGCAAGAVVNCPYCAAPITVPGQDEKTRGNSQAIAPPASEPPEPGLGKTSDDGESKPFNPETLPPKLKRVFYAVRTLQLACFRRQRAIRGLKPHPALGPMKPRPSSGIEPGSRPAKNTD